MYRHVACSNGSGAAAGCCASSRLHGGSLRWSGGTCGPCPGRGSSCPLMSGHASLCACAQPLWSIGCLGCVWRPCGMGRSKSPQRICRWSPHPPSRSWGLAGLRSDAQHAPKGGGGIQRRMILTCQISIKLILCNNYEKQSNTAAAKTA